VVQGCRAPRRVVSTGPEAPELPTPEQVVENAFDFAEKLLEAQREFARNLLEAAAPALPLAPRLTKVRRRRPTPEAMKAVQLVRWQEEPELREVAVPEPGPNEVLVKVDAAASATPIST
jgi:hypothetical protein